MAVFPDDVARSDFLVQPGDCRLHLFRKLLFNLRIRQRIAMRIAEVALEVEGLRARWKLLLDHEWHGRIRVDLLDCELGNIVVAKDEGTLLDGAYHLRRRRRTAGRR